MIYQKPKDKYQHFVERFARRRRKENPHIKKSSLQEEANKEWKVVKDDPLKVDEFLKLRAGEKELLENKKSNFKSLYSFFSPKPPAQPVTIIPVSSPADFISSSDLPSSSLGTSTSSSDLPSPSLGASISSSSLSSPSPALPSSSNQDDTYPNAAESHNVDFVNQVLSKECKDMMSYILHLEVGDDVCNAVLNDSVIWNEIIFSTTCKNVSTAWTIFHNLREKYYIFSPKGRTSKLSNTLSEIHELEIKLCQEFTLISGISTSSSAGITNLVRNLNLKKEKILEAVSSLLNLQIKVSERDLVYGLRRRLVQQQKAKSYEENFPVMKQCITCFNNNSLSWESAFEVLIEIENGNSEWEGQEDKCLSISELINLGNLIKDCTAISESELAFYVPNRLSAKISTIITQVAVHFPVMILNKTEFKYIVNMHQIDFNDDELDRIFLFDEVKENVPVAKQGESSRNVGHHGGRKSILEKFPDIPFIATEYIKSCGFKAQERRRNSTITACGVSVKDIRNHLHKSVPGLKECGGISESTVRYLFKPVRKGTFAAEQYKSVIDAAVPCKDNSLRKDNVNAHYLSSRVKLRREFCAHFKEECTILSADSMNKIRYGTLAVSRYHQIRRIFLSNDTPKYLDHDFPLPYKTIPDGIMILSDNNENDLFIDDDLVNCSEPSPCRDLHYASSLLSDKITQDALQKSLFRAAYEMGEEVSLLEKTVTELQNYGHSSLTVESLREKVLAFMKDEGITEGFEEIETSMINLNSANQMISCIARIFQMKFIIFNNSTLAPIVIGNSVSFNGVITIGTLLKNHDELIFFDVSRITDPDSLKTFEEVDASVTVEQSDQESETINDELDRKHVKYPHTGPSIIYLRNNIFHENTCLEHVNDLFPIFLESIKKKKSVLFLISDDGPDYNPNSVKNLLLYARLFKKTKVNMFGITSYAAGWSALNPIEHLWSKCSNKLTSVHLDSSVREDGIPPCKDTSINKDERKSQEKILLERGAKDISAYWSELTFDGHAVVPIPVDCDGRPGDFLKDATDICNFLGAGIRDIKSNKHKEVLKLFKFAAKHVDRRKNEITFRKCQFFNKTPCNFCQHNPPTAENVLGNLEKTNGQMYEPTNSASDEDHYLTFLEMFHAENKSNFSKPNEHLPSKSIGKCESCPSWEFSSITESKRHISVLHRNYKSAPPTDKTEKHFVCKIKTCGLIFPSYHKLSVHRKKENHFVRKNAKKAGKVVSSTSKSGTSIKQKVNCVFSGENGCDSADPTDDDTSNDENVPRKKAKKSRRQNVSSSSSVPQEHFSSASDNCDFEIGSNVANDKPTTEATPSQTKRQSRNKTFAQYRFSSSSSEDADD